MRRLNRNADSRPHIDHKSVSTRGERKTIIYTQLKLVMQIQSDFLKNSATCNAFAIHFTSTITECRVDIGDCIIWNALFRQILFIFRCALQAAAHLPCAVLISVYDYQQQSNAKRSAEQSRSRTKQYRDCRFKTESSNIGCKPGIARHNIEMSKRGKSNKCDWMYIFKKRLIFKPAYL